MMDEKKKVTSKKNERKKVLKKGEIKAPTSKKISKGKPKEEKVIKARAVAKKVAVPQQKSSPSDKSTRLLTAEGWKRMMQRQKKEKK